MINKLAAGAIGVALLLSSAIPTFASGFDNLTLVKNKAWLKNIVVIKANVGENSIMANEDVEGGSILTGAASAAALVDNMLNTNELSCGCPTEDNNECCPDECGCEDECGCQDENDNGSGLIIKNLAEVKNIIIAKANTGDNLIWAEDEVEGGSVNTGAADAAAVITNVVNTNMVGVGTTSP
ncbi:MAG: hypothetical protein PHV63_03425 [Candidatus Daviesbacteria bacterium]|nr:hypothetical protein [Candidatus Daviesbacteria bacterium]